MCEKHWAILSPLIGALLLASASDAAAQWGNPTFVNHCVASQARHNAYQMLRVQGMQIHLQQELLRAELARARSQRKFERRYASLRTPGSSWQLANTAPSLAGSDQTQPAAVPQGNLGLTQRDVDATREHYESLAQIHAILREHLISWNSQRRVTSDSPARVNRTSGSVVWPALLREDRRFSDDVRSVSQDLAKWAQNGCDPTSMAARRVRKTVEKMSRDLLVMRTRGLIDQTAYNATREFLERTAYETQFTDSEAERKITADFASMR